MYEFLCGHILKFFLYIYQGVEFMGHMLTLYLSEGLPIVFQSVCTILYAHLPYMKVPISPHPCQHLLLPGFFILAILVDGKFYFIVSFHFPGD